MIQGQCYMSMSNTTGQLKVGDDDPHGYQKNGYFLQVILILMVDLRIYVHYESGCSGNQIKVFMVENIGSSTWENNSIHLTKLFSCWDVNFFPRMRYPLNAQQATKFPTYDWERFLGVRMGFMFDDPGGELDERFYEDKFSSVMHQVTPLYIWIMQ